MFSGHFGNTVLSVAIGCAIGLADATGFFYTARLFVVNATSVKRAIAGIAEGARLVLFVTVVLFLWHVKIVPLPWLLCSAILVSIVGKIFFIVKGLKP
ncbi:MAG TPA: hypothetical protein VLX68_12695 [Chitinivibrionales bacterium]|nr:hypothetical protein [Chitinivibrionales bacterium]